VSDGEFAVGLLIQINAAVDFRGSDGIAIDVKGAWIE